MIETSAQAVSASSERERLLRAAEASPDLAGRHDKDAWLALYSDDAILEDPVGTPPSHKGKRPGPLGDELGRFYEAFIAPTNIAMVTRGDIISDHYVFRAVDIHTGHPKTGIKMTVPANLLYEVVSDDGALTIRRMQAHWELNRMSGILMRQGMVGLRTIAAMTWSMWRAFGLWWLLSYSMASIRGVGRKGKDVVERLAGQTRRGEVFAPQATIELPGGATASVDEFFNGCTELQMRDLLAAGRTVSGLASIGWRGLPREAAFIAEFDGRRVRRLRWFWEA